MANNIIKRVWNQNRMVNIEDLSGMAFQAEDGGHTFEISGIDDTGAVVALSGTVAGVFRRPDNADIALTGSASGGVASVTLTDDCYAVPGRIALTIFVTSDGQTVAVYACVGTVAATSGGAVAGDTPQDVVDLINAIEAAVATIPASYTDLMAAVAPDYSSSAVYSVGAYAWYGGELLKCIYPITVGESFNDAHWTSAVVGNDLENVYNILDDITTQEKILTALAVKTAGSSALPAGVSSVQGAFRGMNVSNPGNLTGTTSASYNTFYIQAASEMDVVVDVSSAANSVKIGIFANSPYGEANRVSPIYDSGLAEYPLPTKDSPLHVKAGQYISWSYSNGPTLENSAWSLYSITNGTASLNGDLPLTAQMVRNVNQKMQDGWQPIPESFELGGYSAYNSKDSRTYRVRTSSYIEYPYDYFIIAEEGYTVVAYLDDSTVLSSYPIIHIPKNKKACVYVRRMTEDTTETVDVATFAAAIKMSTKLSDMILHAPTFTDVSMFLRVGIGGDSYAAGGGIISGIRPLTWGKNLERQAGIDVDIYAKSGQTVVQWVTDATNGLPALLAGEECGLYWLQHGINGTSTPEELGTSADMSANPHPATFYGQYTEAVQQIQATFPNARIVLATITGTSFGLYQTIYANVNTAIRDIAEYCSVPVVEITKDEFYRSLWYSSGMRSNHPTAMIAAGMAMANRRLISKCIQENPSYFVEFGSN